MAEPKNAPMRSEDDQPGNVIVTASLSVDDKNRLQTTTHRAWRERALDFAQGTLEHAAGGGIVEGAKAVGRAFRSEDE